LPLTLPTGQTAVCHFPQGFFPFFLFTDAPAVTPSDSPLSCLPVPGCFLSGVPTSFPPFCPNGFFCREAELFFQGPNLLQARERLLLLVHAKSLLSVLFGLDFFCLDLPPAIGLQEDPPPFAPPTFSRSETRTPWSPPSFFTPSFFLREGPDFGAHLFG